MPTHKLVVSRKLSPEKFHLFRLVVSAVSNDVSRKCLNFIEVSQIEDNSQEFTASSGNRLHTVKLSDVQHLEKGLYEVTRDECDEIEISLSAHTHYPDWRPRAHFRNPVVLKTTKTPPVCFEDFSSSVSVAASGVFKSGYLQDAFAPFSFILSREDDRITQEKHSTHMVTYETASGVARCIINPLRVL